MQFNEVNNKDLLRSLVVSSVNTYMYVHVPEFHVLVDCSTVYRRHFFWHFTIALVLQLITQAVSLPPRAFLFSFHCFISVMGVCSSYSMGAHGRVARISQPWEQSSSRRWLPTVEAPACLRHTSSILAMQLLILTLLCCLGV